MTMMQYMELCKFAACCNAYGKIIELNFKWSSLNSSSDFSELKYANYEINLLHNTINFVHGVMKLRISHNSWFLYKNWFKISKCTHSSLHCSTFISLWSVRVIFGTVSISLIQWTVCKIVHLKTTFFQRGIQYALLVCRNPD